MLRAGFEPAREDPVGFQVQRLNHSAITATDGCTIVSKHFKGDVNRDDSQRRFLAQQNVAMLEQCCKHSKQCRNNVATLCCAKNRRCESSRVISP